MLKEYFEYLKDNPKNLWFKKKLYGYGWVPVKWQGWLVIGIFIIFITWSSFDIKSTSSNNDMIWFFVKIFLTVMVLLFIAYKTGEKPCWQWGIPKEKK